jgi:hypothetical protein
VIGSSAVLYIPVSAEIYGERRPCNDRHDDVYICCRLFTITAAAGSLASWHSISNTSIAVLAYRAGSAVLDVGVKWPPDFYVTRPLRLQQSLQNGRFLQYWPGELSG